MRPDLRYGRLTYDGASPGDVVRFVPGSQVGQTGAICQARTVYERNALLKTVQGDMGLVEIISSGTLSSGAQSDVGSASGISLSIPIKAGGKVTFGK